MKGCTAKAQEIAKKFESLTLQEIKKMPFELGVDEAGRGPIFGPMIYSALWWPKEFAQQLSALGFTDSKKLSEANRELLFQAIQVLKGKAIFYAYNEISPEYISNKMLAQKNQESLNIISHKAAIGLIKKAIAEGFNIANVYLDTVGDAGKYQDKVNEELQNDKIEVKVSAKADLYFKVVSASSIIAKVTRDHKLRDWKFVQDINTEGQIGSGYPSDPKTVNWLKVNYNQVFGYPNLIRFSWATLQNMQKVPRIQFKNKAAHPKFDPDYVLRQKYGLTIPKSSIFATVQEP